MPRLGRVHVASLPRGLARVLAAVAIVAELGEVILRHQLTVCIHTHARKKKEHQRQPRTATNTQFIISSESDACLRVHAALQVRRRELPALVGVGSHAILLEARHVRLLCLRAFSKMVERERPIVGRLGRQSARRDGGVGRHIVERALGWRDGRVRALRSLPSPVLWVVPEATPFLDLRGLPLSVGVPRPTGRQADRPAHERTNPSPESLRRSAKQTGLLS